jgi:predicted RNA-binding Zn-ribbon protein involved in translation (DUF1610 family)
MGLAHSGGDHHRRPDCWMADRMTDLAGVTLSVLKEAAQDAQVRAEIWRAQLEPMPTPVIRAEVNRRTAAESPKHKSLRACVGCGAMLGARERRLPCPKCGARNPRK